MPVQTTYSSEHTAGFEGQRADFGLTNNFTKACELAAGINFGRAVVRGTADDQATLPTATGQDFIGFTNQTTAGQANSSDVHLYQQYQSMNIMDFGPVYLYTETSVVPGDKVFYRHTAKGGNTVIGRVRNDADVNTADEVKYATFESTASAGSLALVWLRGNERIDQLFETITATSGALSLDTLVSQFDTTLGASTSTLADGIEGQTKILEMIVDGGDMVVTPANLFNGTTLTFKDVGDSVTLQFIDGDWHVIASSGIAGIDGPFVDPTSETITAVGPTAISLATSTTLFDTTLGAATSTLADGQIGQVKRLIMTVDGGDMVVTPANLADGTTLTFKRVGDTCTLIFLGSSWHMISVEGVQGLTNSVIEIVNPSLETITAAGAGAVSVSTNVTLIDSTLGVQALTLADGELGQKKIIKMIADGGDSVVTPSNLFDGTTLTFDDVNDSCELIFLGSNWYIVSINGVTLA